MYAIIRTTLQTALICALTLGILGEFISGTERESYFLFFFLNSFFNIFLGPVLILTLVYYFIYKRNPAHSKREKFIRLRLLLFSALVGLFLWYALEVYNNLGAYYSMAWKELREFLLHNESNIGLIYLIPVCLIINYIYDKVKKDESPDVFENTE